MKTLASVKRVLRSLLVLSVFIASVSYAGNVGGFLFGVGPYGQYPAQRIPVTLFSNNMGRSTASYTDYQGNYYISNVPPGGYVLEIWINRHQPIRINITVFDQPFTQLPPYRVF